MRTVQLLRYPDSFLRQPAREVTDEEFAAGKVDGYKLDVLLSKMYEIMRNRAGAGLAATQVGAGIRLWIARFKKGSDIQFVFNPVLCGQDGIDCQEEGCLSVPNVWGKVERAKKVTVMGRNSKGASVVLELDGIAARIAQHETDHLDGVLFVDHVSKDESLEELREAMGVPVGDDPIASFIRVRRRFAWKIGGDELLLGLDPFYLKCRAGENTHLLDIKSSKGSDKLDRKEKKRKKRKK